MNLLCVTYDGTSVTAMRPEYPVKTFGSADVPDGSNSVIYCSAKNLQSQGAAVSIGLPQFSVAERSAIDSTNKAITVSPNSMISSGR